MKVFPSATIGLPPQDLKYRGQPTRVEIGPRTQIREHVTIHRGSVGGEGVTRIGADCLLMVGAHVAHDCTLGDRVILANNVLLAGHVTIGDTVFVGGGAAVHQFVRIGRHAVIGGVTRVEADVIPYGSAMGNRARLVGLNLIGLQRRGFSRAEIHTLRAAFRSLLSLPGLFEERVAATEAAFGSDPRVAEILAFIRADSRRGLCRAWPQPRRRGGAGGGLMAAEPLGIIAGGGPVPRRVADAARAAGRPVFVVVLEGHGDPAAWAGYPHVVLRFGLAARMLSWLKERGVRQLVLCGTVTRPPSSPFARMPMSARLGGAHRPPCLRRG